MLFGDGHIEIAIGKLFLKAYQAGTFTHGRRDSDQTFIACRHIADPIAEDIAEGRLRGRLARKYALLGIERTDAMIFDGIGFGWRVALPFLGDHMQELWARETLNIAQRADQRLHIMTVYGADVIETELLKESARDNQALYMLLGASGKLAYGRHAGQHFLTALAYGGV